MESKTIIGSVIGDVLGSIYEWDNIKSTDFELLNPNCHYTDDTVLTVAIADSLLNNVDFSTKLLEYGRKFPNVGYGGSFKNWLLSDEQHPYNSFGNGSAMRVSSIGFAFRDIESVLQKAKETAEVTHNHPEGIKGAQATASAIYLAQQGQSKKEIRAYISETFSYDLNFTIAEIRDNYYFDPTCQGSVPQAIVAFLDSSDFESAIRLAISLGGDSDTIACIAGGVASAFYKDIPKSIEKFVLAKLPIDFINVIGEFNKKYK